MLHIICKSIIATDKLLSTTGEALVNEDNADDVVESNKWKCLKNVRES